MSRSAALLRDLRRADRLDLGATVLLRSLLTVAGEALADSRWSRRGRLLRALLHLRGDASEGGLYVLEAGAESAQTADEETRLPSNTAARLVQERGRPVLVDTVTEELRSLDGEELALAPARPFDSEASLQRLRQRDATHLVLLPVMLPGRGFVGLVSVEGACPGATGEAWIWPACVAALQEQVEVCGPILALLPAPAREAADPLLPVVGKAMAPVVRMLRVFARQDDTLLIGGPTGAGKSRLARWCHARSARSGGPFETVDLQSVPEDLQMGTLFGWRRGAFTSAVRDQAGCVERARGGTLFLDELDKLSLRAQAGLLRLIEERRYAVLGEATDKVADVRFIVGTNADLPALVREGRFREDLYYRINVLPVRLPTLRERADEIPAWARFMLQRRAEEAGASAQLDESAAAALSAAPWPGNLRQLDNVVRRAYMLARAERAEPLVLRETHVASALRYEGGPSATGATSAVGALERAAAQIVAAALARREQAGPLPFELCAGLTGFILAEAEAQLGSREEAMRLLGEETQVKNRNHGRAWKRELALARQLCLALGEAPPAVLREG